MSKTEGRAIVVLGGFLSMAPVYNGLRRELSALTELNVWVVDTRPFDWLSSVSKVGWFLVLNKLDLTLKKASKKSGMSKVTLIGHSQGGVLARLYLRPEPFMGKSFYGLEQIDHLITLGSPHLNLGGVKRGGQMARWIERYVPGSTYSPKVHYTSVAGKFIQGNPHGTPYERFAYRTYKEICSIGETWGDGITPISSALLPGSNQITLSNVCHYSLMGAPWYGSKEIVPLWWRKSAI